MNMQDLAGRVQAGHIDALHLVSLEGGIYVLEAQMGDRAIRWRTISASRSACAPWSMRARYCAG